MKKKLSVLFTCVLALVALPTHAQWLTQTLTLKAGWNAVFLHVDASYATLDQLIGSMAPSLTPIEQVWRWNPNPATAQFIVSPPRPVDLGNQWTSWKRSEGGTSPLQRLAGNTAYLIFSTIDYSWDLKGQPVLPTYSWSTSGLNLFGFPTVTNNPPNFDNFLAGAPSLQLGEIYTYPGGDLSTNNPGLLYALRTTPVLRGDAYWIRAGEIYNRYYGPFEVTAAGSGRVAFGDSLSTFSFRLKNLTENPLTVALQLTASEVPPANQLPIVAAPPLLLRGIQNKIDLTYGFSQLLPNTPSSWVLTPKGQPGSEVEVVLGLDRANATGNPGDLLAGVLQLTDSLGHTHVDLAVSATVASEAGLWVGAAAVNEVGQYLLSYLRDNDSQLIVNTNGAYIVTSVVTNLTPVPTAYPLRLIVHNPSSGPATLLQRVYYGFNVASNSIVANQEAALAPNLLGAARRISASHLPWSEANPGWFFNRSLAQGAILSVLVTNLFNDQVSNPFLHTYHPDHDNLDAQFKNELPQGSESYTVVRQVTLSVTPPANHFASRVAAGLTLTGEYLETIRVLGLARAGNSYDARRFDVKGDFKLNRISEISTLTRVP